MNKFLEINIEGCKYMINTDRINFFVYDSGPQFLEIVFGTDEMSKCFYGDNAVRAWNALYNWIGES